MKTILIISTIFLSSCGFTNFIDRVERPYNDLWDNTEAIIVETRENNHIYGISGGGMYTYRIHDQFGKWDDLDTILVRDYPEIRGYVDRIETNY